MICSGSASHDDITACVNSTTAIDAGALISLLARVTPGLSQHYIRSDEASLSEASIKYEDLPEEEARHDEHSDLNKPPQR